MSVQVTALRPVSMSRYNRVQIEPNHRGPSQSYSEHRFLLIMRQNGIRAF